MDPRINIIDRRFEKVKRIIAVSGGKGGIGKSQTAAALALLLASKNYRAGLLDLDFCGPSSHVILGIKGVYPEEDRGIIPPEIHGIRFMSITFYTGSYPSPLRGSEISNAIIEMLAITRWEDLDYLIIDMPPGTGDPVLDVIRLIKRTEFLLVTIPSKVALGVMKRELQVLKELDIPVVGIIENMKSRGISAVANDLSKLPEHFLGSIDFDNELEAALGDPGRLLETKFTRQLDKIINNFSGVRVNYGAKA